jgi:hypothetical protein
MGKRFKSSSKKRITGTRIPGSKIISNLKKYPIEMEAILGNVQVPPLQ